jgi:hypothetical protein
MPPSEAVQSISITPPERVSAATALSPLNCSSGTTGVLNHIDQLRYGDGIIAASTEIVYAIWLSISQSMYHASGGVFDVQELSDSLRWAIYNNLLIFF